MPHHDGILENVWQGVKESFGLDYFLPEEKKNAPSTHHLVGFDGSLHASKALTQALLVSRPQDVIHIPFVHLQDNPEGSEEEFEAAAKSFQTMMEEPLERCTKARRQCDPILVPTPTAPSDSKASNQEVVGAVLCGLSDYYNAKYVYIGAYGRNELSPGSDDGKKANPDLPPPTFRSIGSTAQYILQRCSANLCLARGSARSVKYMQNPPVFEDEPEAETESSMESVPTPAAQPSAANTMAATPVAPGTASPTAPASTARSTAPLTAHAPAHTLTRTPAQTRRDSVEDLMEALENDDDDIMA